MGIVWELKNLNTLQFLILKNKKPAHSANALPKTAKHLSPVVSQWILYPTSYSLTLGHGIPF